MIGHETKFSSPPLSPTILLLGGGYVLSTLAQRLDKHYFVITTRSAQKKKSFEASGYLTQIVDLEHIESLQQLFVDYPSLSVVVDSVPAHLNLQAVRDIFASRSIQRILYLSTTGVYGHQDGSWVDERTPCTPQHPRAHARLETENGYRSGITPSCSLRIAGIYGPGRGIGTALQRGSYRLIEGGNRWSNRIHVEDLAAIIAALIKHPSPPPIVCASDDTPALASDVVSFYCDTFKLPRPACISLDQAITEGRFTQLSNQRVSNALLKQILGRELRFPSYREGAHTEFEG